MNLSIKSYSVLFRLFLAVFVLAYFVPNGLKLHAKHLFHIPFDYLGHAVFCFLLFALYIKSFIPGKIKGAFGQLPLRLIVLALVVFSFEVIQQFIPNRSFDGYDVLANFIGMALGTGVGLQGNRQ